MLRKLTVLALFCLVLVLTLPARAAQPLPVSPWYAVLWTRSDDRLYWVNQNGQQATLPRPRLPNEAPLAQANPRLRIAPDGRHMLIAAELNSGLEGLGIYDIENGQFRQIHTAQATEKIGLGSEYSFTQDGRFAAVGFISGDFDQADWRIITFEMATGNPLKTLTRAAALNVVGPTNYVLPYVTFYNLNQEMENVHFQLISQATGGAFIYPAYGWSPQSGQVFASPYRYSTMDILPTTGEMALPAVAESYPLLEPDGSFTSTNGAARELPNQPVGFEAIDGSVYFNRVRWAKGGQWMLYETRPSGGSGNWNITETDGTPETNFQFPFESDVTNAYGTPDGYLFMNSINELYYTNGFTTNTAPKIWEAANDFELVYVTPTGASFNLPAVGGASSDGGGSPRWRHLRHGLAGSFAGQQHSACHLHGWEDPARAADPRWHHHHPDSRRHRLHRAGRAAVFGQFQLVAHPA